MTHTSIRFTFDGSVPMDEVEQTLRLALLAVESLHGEDRVMLEAGSRVDHAGHERARSTLEATSAARWPSCSPASCGGSSATTP